MEDFYKLDLARGSGSAPKMVKCKLKLNSSLTDSVRDDFQLQFGSSHFHGPAHTVPFSAAGINLGWVAGRSGGRAARLATRTFFTSDPVRALTLFIILKGRWSCWVLFLRPCPAFL